MRTTYHQSVDRYVSEVKCLGKRVRVRVEVIKREIDIWVGCRRARCRKDCIEKDEDEKQQDIPNRRHVDIAVPTDDAITS